MSRRNAHVSSNEVETIPVVIIFKVVFFFQHILYFYIKFMSGGGVSTEKKEKAKNKTKASLVTIITRLFLHQHMRCFCGALGERWCKIKRARLPKAHQPKPTVSRAPSNITERRFLLRKFLETAFYCLIIHRANPGSREEGKA